MIIDKKIANTTAAQPKPGSTTLFVNLDDQLSIKTSADQVSTIPTLKINTSYIGDTVSVIDRDQILDLGAVERARFVKAFHRMGWKTRARMACTGGTEYFKPGDLQNAVIVRGNTQADLTAALAAADARTTSTSARYVILTRDIEGVSAQISIPQNVVLMSLNGSRIVPASGQSHRILIQSYSSIVGVWLVDMQIQISQGATSCVGSRIIACRFTGTVTDASGAKIWDRGGSTLTSIVNTHAVIALNEAEGNAYFFRRDYTEYFKVIGNKYTNPFASGTMIWQRGGQFNEDAYNIQNGGRVGHICLFDRRVSRGYNNNRVHNNWFENISEEGYSIDVNGNGFTGSTITSIEVLNGGSGYVTAPTVTISAPSISGGVQATATAVLTGGVVTSITLTNGGTNYLGPTVTIGAPPGGGTQATARAVFANTPYYQGLMDTVQTYAVASGFGTPGASPQITVVKNNMANIDPAFMQFL